jgi:hypothetical protein
VAANAFGTVAWTRHIRNTATQQPSPNRAQRSLPFVALAAAESPLALARSRGVDDL